MEYYGKSFRNVGDRAQDFNLKQRFKQLKIIKKKIEI